MRIAATAARLLTPLEELTPGVVIVEDGRFVAAGSRAAVELPPGIAVRDFGDATLAPGLVDIHVHGGGGRDVMEATPEALTAMARQLLRHGVTAFCPTTVTAPWTELRLALERLAATLAARPAADGAQPLGIHLEGPFVSAAQAGVHPRADLVAPDPERFEQLWQAAQGRIALLTLAPELPGAEAVITLAAGRGVTVSLGHSDATAAQTRAALGAGARHFTHTFNAMRALHQREPGILGEALLNAGASADLIADGIHVDPALVRMFFALKGPERAVLISDAIAAAGCGDGQFRLGPLQVEVRGPRCEAGERLAGSVLSLDGAVRNAMRFANLDLVTAVRAASWNPARLIGTGQKGHVAPGCDADLIVLSSEGELRAVMARGQWLDRT